MFKNMLAALALTMTTLTTPAYAQPAPCKVSHEMYSILEDQYGEQRYALGLMSQTRVMELFTSEKGSWSLLSTSVQGESCLVGSGQNFIVVESEETEEEEQESF